MRKLSPLLPSFLVTGDPVSKLVEPPRRGNLPTVRCECVLCSSLLHTAHLVGYQFPSVTRMHRWLAPGGEVQREDRKPTPHPLHIVELTLWGLGGRGGVTRSITTTVSYAAIPVLVRFNRGMAIYIYIWKTPPHPPLPQMH